MSSPPATASIEPSGLKAAALPPTLDSGARLREQGGVGRLHDHFTRGLPEV
jgi:hypothetical protein